MPSTVPPELRSPAPGSLFRISSGGPIYEVFGTAEFVAGQRHPLAHLAVLRMPNGHLFLMPEDYIPEHGAGEICQFWLARSAILQSQAFPKPGAQLLVYTGAAQQLAYCKPLEEFWDLFIEQKPALPPPQLELPWGLQP